MDLARPQSVAVVRLRHVESDRRGYVEQQHPKFRLGLPSAKANAGANSQPFRLNVGKHYSEK